MVLFISYPKQTVRGFDQLGRCGIRLDKSGYAGHGQPLQDAAALGVTVCCTAGDNGSTDGVNDGRLYVDFPASSPYALACGGTRLEGSGGTITKEIVWNEGVSGGATGGGGSDVFDLPKWQAKALANAQAIILVCWWGFLSGTKEEP